MQNISTKPGMYFPKQRIWLITGVALTVGSITVYALLKRSCKTHFIEYVTVLSVVARKLQ